MLGTRRSGLSFPVLPVSVEAVYARNMCRGRWHYSSGLGRASASMAFRILDVLGIASKI